MNAIILDGKKMTNREEGHNYLKEMFDFPDYYGKNLDALWDILTSMSEPIAIKLVNKNSLIENLGTYGENIVTVFLDATKSNPNITFIIESD